MFIRYVYCRLTFSAWGKVEFITYVGFFRWRTYVDGSHVIQIAMASNSAKQNRFIGQISQLMIGDRLVGFLLLVCTQ